MTAPEIELTTIEELDFNPECLMDDGNPGEWEAVLPCGHHHGLFCTDHLEDLIEFPEETLVCATCAGFVLANDVLWRGPL